MIIYSVASIVNLRKRDQNQETSQYVNLLKYLAIGIMKIYDLNGVDLDRFFDMRLFERHQCRTSCSVSLSIPILFTSPLNNQPTTFPPTPSHHPLIFSVTTLLNFSTLLIPYQAICGLKINLPLSLNSLSLAAFTNVLFSPAGSST